MAGAVREMIPAFIDFLSYMETDRRKKSEHNFEKIQKQKKSEQQIQKIESKKIRKKFKFKFKLKFKLNTQTH